MVSPVKFSLDDSVRAYEQWRFSCGPAALCAVLDMTPDEIRPHLGDFEQRGYVNPTQMLATLHTLKIKFRKLYQGLFSTAKSWDNLPNFGLIRVQFGGPWMAPEVPMAARYQHTHWVAVRNNPAMTPQRQVFDINAMCAGGWIPFGEWKNEMMPWLVKESNKRCDGTFFPTHCLEITR